MPRQLLTYATTSPRSTELIKALLDGRGPSLNWTLSQASRRQELEFPSRISADHGSCWVVLNCLAGGDFFLMVSDGDPPASVFDLGGPDAALAYGVTLAEAHAMIGDEFRGWLLGAFRYRISQQLDRVRSAVSCRYHEDARSLLERAMEMSRELEAIEGDAVAEVRNRWDRPAPATDEPSRAHALASF